MSCLWIIEINMGKKSGWQPMLDIGGFKTRRRAKDKMEALGLSASDSYQVSKYWIERAWKRGERGREEAR